GLRLRLPPGLHLEGGPLVDRRARHLRRPHLLPRHRPRLPPALAGRVRGEISIAAFSYASSSSDRRDSSSRTRAETDRLRRAASDRSLSRRSGSSVSVILFFIARALQPSAEDLVQRHREPGEERGRQQVAGFRGELGLAAEALFGKAVDLDGLED